MAKTKKVHVINLGCSKNQVDSENILGEFTGRGVEIAPDQDGADFVLLNTCGFIDSAKEESVNEILATVERKEENQKILVAGCLSERYMDELKVEIPEVDKYFGTYKPGEIIASLGDLSGVECGDETGRRFLAEAPHHAYVKIAEGCNRVCGFCAIPHMRGKQDSRSIADIISEIQKLQSQGIMEVSLVAQDLTYFGREKARGETLNGLLKAILRDTDIPWTRLMYNYPAFIDDELLDMIGNEKRICNYFDMPIQHVSTPVLNSMRRGYNGDQLRKIIRDIKTRIPNICLRTTVLTGYPGETEDDFKELLDFVAETRFNRLGGFTYSDEEGTYAADIKDLERVPEEVMKERLDLIMEVQQQISLDHNMEKVGQELDVIIDETDSGNPEFPIIARTEFDAPEVDNTVLIKDSSAVTGTFRKIKVTDAYEFDLVGELVAE